jgi:hypothetical protein
LFAMAQPRYLTGDKTGIQEFLEKFDVSRGAPGICEVLVSLIDCHCDGQVFLFDCDGKGQFLFV